VTTPEQLYAAVVIGLLLAAIGLSIPVLKGIYRDGLERHSKRQASETETEDSEPTVSAGGTPDHRHRRCGQCGVENDPAFTYCRNCTAPL